jgi:hypothetical protein
MASNMVVYGYEEATKYEVLLDEKGFGFPFAPSFQKLCHGTASTL